MSKHVCRCRQCSWITRTAACFCFGCVGRPCSCPAGPFCLGNLNNLVAKFRPGLVLGIGKYSTINLCASVLEYCITASGDSGDAKLETTWALSCPLCHCCAWMLSNAANGKYPSMHMVGRQDHSVPVAACCTITLMLVTMVALVLA